MTGRKTKILSAVGAAFGFSAGIIAYDFWHASQEVLRQVKLPDAQELDFTKSVGTGGVAVEPGVTPTAELKDTVVKLIGENTVSLTQGNRVVVLERDETSFALTKKQQGTLPFLSVQSIWSVQVGKTIDEPIVQHTTQLKLGEYVFASPLLASSAYQQESESSTRRAAFGMIQFVDDVVERVADDRVHLTDQDPYYTIAKDIYDFSFAPLKTQSDGTLVEPVRANDLFKGALHEEGVANADKKKTKSLKKMEDGSFIYLQKLGVKDEINGNLQMSVMLDVDGTVSVIHAFVDDEGEPRSATMHMLDTDGDISAALVSVDGEDVATRRIKPFLSKDLVEAYAKAARKNVDQILQRTGAPNAGPSKLSVWNKWKKKGRVYVV